MDALSNLALCGHVLYYTTRMQLRPTLANTTVQRWQRETDALLQCDRLFVQLPANLVACMAEYVVAVWLYCQVAGRGVEFLDFW